MFEGLIVLLCGAKSFRELLGGQPSAVIWGGGVVELPQQFIERVLIPQWQPDGETQTLIGWQVSDRSQVLYGARDVRRLQSLSLGCAGNANEQHQKRPDGHGPAKTRSVGKHLILRATQDGKEVP